MPSWSVINHSGQLSLLSSAGCQVSAGQGGVARQCNRYGTGVVMRGCEFDSRPFCKSVTYHTHVTIVDKTVQTRTCQTAVLSDGCEGNCRSGVIVAICHRFTSFIHLWVQGLQNGDEEQPLYGASQRTALVISYVTVCYHLTTLPKAFHNRGIHEKNLSFVKKMTHRPLKQQKLKKNIDPLSNMCIRCRLNIFTI